MSSSIGLLYLIWLCWKSNLHFMLKMITSFLIINTVLSIDLNKNSFLLNKQSEMFENFRNDKRKKLFILNKIIWSQNQKVMKRKWNLCDKRTFNSHWTQYLILLQFPLIRIMICQNSLSFFRKKKLFCFSFQSNKKKIKFSKREIKIRISITNCF
jgi:hypothetical protein